MTRVLVSHLPQRPSPVGGAIAIRIGFATLAIAFGGGAAWSALAPLHAAAVAHGEVKVENSRKTVQHMEGGIIRQILVKDGQAVDGGQPLVQLDDTAIRAKWTQLMSQMWDSQANRARLVAERDGLAAPDFSALDGHQAKPRVAEVIRAQRQLFKARRDMLNGEVAVLTKRIELQAREIDALSAEQLSKDRQLKLIQQEVASTQYLVDRGLGRRPQLLALKREGEKLTGERDDYGARIARLRQAQASTELDIANISYKHMDDVATDLRKVEADIRDLEQQIAAAQDALKRTIVRSPQNGVVVGLKVHTRGGVVQPGEPLMDIVPRNENLIVEARISPEDIDRVFPGREAQIRFHTFLRGLTPPVDGTVAVVSADLFRDERNGQPYYTARVDLDPQSLKKLPGPLTPGMQSDVLVITGERTALEYLLSPLTRAMDMAMREK